MLLFLGIFAVVLVFYFIIAGFNWYIENVVTGILLSFLVAVVMCSLLEVTAPDDTYYLPCEVLASNDTSTYFGTVDSGSQEIFAVETGDHIWPDDVPYLLYMDGKGTPDMQDDEVLVVWRTD